jgi:hypothetical protein
MTNRSLKSRLASIRRRAQAASEQPLPASVQAYLDGAPNASVPEPQPSDRDGEDRRRFSRSRVKSELTMRRIGGFNLQVALSDLSPGGCNVELIEAAEAGDSVIARFPHLEPLGSRVCWTEGCTTGVEFLAPIHPAVFDLLLSRLRGRDAET